MIKIEMNLGHRHDIEQFAGELLLSYDQRKKGRLHAETTNGLEVGLFLERGKVLRDGDVLQANSGEYILVRASNEQLTEGRCEDWLTFSKCCYHLGNRHVPIEIEDRVLRLQSDHILKDMLSQLGMDVRECEGPFNPEQGAYSGGHHHHHDH